MPTIITPLIMNGACDGGRSGDGSFEPDHSTLRARTPPTSTRVSASFHWLLRWRTPSTTERHEGRHKWNDVSQACFHSSPDTPLPNGPRLSCGALKKDSFLSLRAPSASSAG